MIRRRAAERACSICSGIPRRPGEPWELPVSDMTLAFAQHRRARGMLLDDQLGDVAISLLRGYVVACVVAVTLTGVPDDISSAAGGKVVG